MEIIIELINSYNEKPIPKLWLQDFKILPDLIYLGNPNKYIKTYKLNKHKLLCVTFNNGIPIKYEFLSTNYTILI